MRGCGEPLARAGATWSCERGHTFDPSRSGYLNLLQPQDRKSKHPGDSKAAAAARRRLSDAGLENAMRDEVLREYDSLPSGEERRRAVLDVGCGEGFLLGSLAGSRALEAHGIDISALAIDLAAKRYPGATWIVGNADRGLPWRDGSFDLVLSVTARRNGPEMRRVLRASGRVLVAVPGPDDLAELRKALLGKATERDRGASAAEELAPDLELLSRRTVRTSARLSAAQIQDLLTATYRGGRLREAERGAGIGDLAVTISRELLVFRAGAPA
ncbi:MAG: methyltransferase domain-containing protein [Acidobacteria bacterium]|nr:methyltransferase domain-containing protein [Acidobacteriota bacterium]MCA1611496.1 methyltransferase domain-containing protein [Acidobacteriota bacterium]